MPVDISNAITMKNIDVLRIVDLEQLMLFNEDGMNAFMFACFTHADYDVVKTILERAITHFVNETTREMILHFEQISIDTNMDEDLDQYGEVGKNFYHFFYGTARVDGIDLYAPALAFRKNQQRTIQMIEQILYLEPIHDDFLPTKVARKKAFVNATKKHGGTSRGVYYSSKLSTPQERLPRSFDQERERQLLKQLSTVLFFYIQPKAKKLVETETLHLRIGNISHLVISCNAGDTISTAFDGIDTMKKLQDKLQKTITVNGNIEGKKRIKRYQEILKSIFLSAENRYIHSNGDTEQIREDINKYTNIADILRDPLINIHLVNNYILAKQQPPQHQIITDLFGNTPLIVIINNEKSHDLGRHAEEYLVDVVDAVRQHAKANSINKEIYSCIGGKKRPCFTCYSTMFTRRIDNHGSRPGYAWQSSLNVQANESSKMTILCMLQQSSYVTKLKNGKYKSDYDSGSDDEEIQHERQVYNIKRK